MYENYKEDGVYELQLNDRNPFGRYLVVKTYGNITKKKAFYDLADCKQQINEWDEDMAATTKGLDGLFKAKKERARENYRNFYSVFDNSGNLIMEGEGSEIAQKFGYKTKTVCTVANTKGRRLTGIIDGQKIKLNVVKNLQSQYDYICEENICW